MCDDNWGLRNAAVVCGQLGYPGVEVRHSLIIIIIKCSKIQSQAATTESQFGLIDGDFSLENVNCAGNETALTDCEHRKQNTCFRWAQHDDDSDLCYLHH